MTQRVAALIQAAQCIQQWWRIEIVGYHLDPARALAKREARRNRAIATCRKRRQAEREAAAFEKTQQWYQRLFSPAQRAAMTQQEAADERDLAKDRQELLAMRRRKANEARHARLRALQPRLIRQQHAAMVLQACARRLLRWAGSQAIADGSGDGADGERRRRKDVHVWGTPATVDEDDILRDNLDRMYAEQNKVAMR
jgi:hypothetical protein